MKQKQISLKLSVSGEDRSLLATGSVSSTFILPMLLGFPKYTRYLSRLPNPLKALLQDGYGEEDGNYNFRVSNIQLHKSVLFLPQYN